MKVEFQFYEKMKNFVIKSLDLLNKKKDNLPLMLDEEIVIENLSESGMSTSSKFIQKPDFTVFVCRLWDELKDSQEYKTCEEYVNKDASIKKHLNNLIGTHEQKGRVDIDRILQTLLLNVIHQQNSLKFNEKIFAQEFKKIKEFFTSPKLKFYAYSPLEGFTSPINGIKLGENLRISKISKEKLIGLLKFGHFGLPIPQHRMFRFRFMLERVYETDKIIGDNNKTPRILPSQETKKIFNEVISALRLFKKGIVGYNFIQTKALNWNPIGGITTTSGIFTYPYFGQYKLDKNEIKDFKNLFQKIKKAPSFLDVPISRFNFASDRERPEDKLIDYITAFESLFVREKQELGYRLSVRASLLIGKNSQKRKEIFNLIKKAYDLRSNIVHGLKYNNNVTINGENISIQDFVSKIEETLRESIKISLDFRNRASFLEKIDEKIFENGII